MLAMKAALKYTPISAGGVTVLVPFRAFVMVERMVTWSSGDKGK
jgi:hypothetical protein